MAAYMTMKLDNIQLCKSVFSVDRILNIKFHYDKFNPKRAGGYIEFPKSINSIKACINIKLRMICVLKYAVQCWVHKIEETNKCITTRRHMTRRQTPREYPKLGW